MDFIDFFHIISINLEYAVDFYDFCHIISITSNMWWISLISYIIDDSPDFIIHSISINLENAVDFIGFLE